MKVKIKRGQKKDEGVKISKSSICPNVQEVADLHKRVLYIISELCSVFIVLAIRIILYLLKAGSRMILMVKLYRGGMGVEPCGHMQT